MENPYYEEKDHFEVNEDEEVLYLIWSNLSTLSNCDAWFSMFYIDAPFRDKANVSVIGNGRAMNVLFEATIAFSFFW